MIYRSVIGMREEDLMHLDSSVLANQQKEIVAKLDRSAPYTKGFGWASALGVVVVIAGEWLLGPGRPPKTQRAGASIRLDERHDDAVSTHQRKPPSSEAA